MHDKRFLPVLITTQNDQWAKVYYDQLVKDHLVKVSFWDKSVRSEEDFLNISRDPRTHHYIVLDLNCKPAKPCASFHLGNFQGLSAQVHFSVLRAYHGSKVSVRIAKESCSWLFTQVTETGDPYLRTIIGIIPKKNRAGISYLKKTGHKILGTIPDAYHIRGTNRSFPAIFSTLTYEDFV